MNKEISIRYTVRILGEKIVFDFDKAKENKYNSIKYKFNMLSTIFRLLILENRHHYYYLAELLSCLDSWHSYFQKHSTKKCLIQFWKLKRLENLRVNKTLLWNIILSCIIFYWSRKSWDISYYYLLFTNTIY